jgi:hypothetical protein
MVSSHLTIAASLFMVACSVDGGPGLVDIEDWEGDPALLQCPDREPEVRAAVVALLDELRAGTRTDVTSVDALLGALPPEVRENIIFLTETRSMAKIYPLFEKKLMSFAETDSNAYSFHREGDRWCSSAGGDTHCVESRVLFTSREADFIGSFTTDPESPSGNRFEMILFDASNSEMTMVDVNFQGGAPVVTMNPESCKMCHLGRDGSLNWRFDPYRFWAYVTPFQEDFLRGDSVETEWYLAFLDRIGSGEDKLGQLRPFNPRQTVVDALAAQGSYQLAAPAAAVDFSGTDSPSLNLSHQLLEKNGCRAAVQMARRDDFDRVKYAAVGGLIGCDNVDDFFPTSGAYTRATAEDYFTAQREGLLGTAFDLETFAAETRRRQADLLSDKLSRRFDHLTEFVGAERAMQELRDAMANGPVAPGYGVTNFEKEDYGTRIALARFLLEPLGVDVTQWSMSVDRVHQSHVEFMHPIVLQPVFIDFLSRELGAELGREFDSYECQDLDTSGPNRAASACYSALEGAREALCPRLAERSRQELLDHPGEEESEAFSTYRVEDLAAIELEARERANSATLEQLATDAGGVYSTCAGCHEYAYDAGFPWLPFQDMNALTTMFRRQRDAAMHQMDGDTVGIARGFGRPNMFTYTSLADRIWDRVNRHPRQHSFMPRTKIPLTRDQKVSLRAHMIKALETEGP